MKKLGKKYEPVVYEGAGHGFMRRRAADAQRGRPQGVCEAARSGVKKILGGALSA